MVNQPFTYLSPDYPNLPDNLGEKDIFLVPESTFIKNKKYNMLKMPGLLDNKALVGLIEKSQNLYSRHLCRVSLDCPEEEL